ncbi:MAG: serine protease [Candidatus Electrothrix sp. ATG2]|nr:serine protease [Candidatus Electrothrix sp. ATG2]
MAIAQDAIFLLTGPEAKRSKIFGTGFAVAHKDGQLYLLTCAHVVEQLEGKVRVGEQEAEVEAIGSGDSIDLALLRIPCAEPPLLLHHIVQGRVDMKFEICGYGPFSGAKGNYVLRDIAGRLGKSIAFESPGNDRVEAWDLHVEDDEFSRLQGGYSGLPLCDEDGFPFPEP